MTQKFLIIFLIIMNAYVLILLVIQQIFWKKTLKDWEKSSKSWSEYCQQLIDQWKQSNARWTNAFEKKIKSEQKPEGVNLD